MQGKCQETLPHAQHNHGCVFGHPDNIANIDGEYYGKRALTFSLGSDDPLMQAFQKDAALQPTDTLL